jgi:phenylalanyl-tRNA synthetase alpha chain
MVTSLAALKAECEKAIAAANDLATLDDVRVSALGKKGRVTELLKTLGTLPEDQRKAFGASVNEVKGDLEARIETRKAALSSKALDARLSSEKADITLSPRAEAQGSIHPVSKTIAEITAIFARQGFAVAEGPDIESDEYNFTLLNIPPDHPARQMQDTFYLNSAAEDQGARAVVPDASAAGTERTAQNQPKVLRTHTSPVQVRTMLNQKPPIRILAPGRTYRYDSDQTHSPMFHQVEGLVIDKDITMGHLKGALMDFLRAFFDVPDLTVRFRPSYFPFTEPSAEVDIGCSRAGGKLKIGGGDDWLEVLGCGMVHEKVLKNCNIDPAQYQGFAFGMGVERLAMLKYGIPDLRTFYESDLRWLKHYGFSPLEA